LTLAENRIENTKIRATLPCHSPYNFFGPCVENAKVIWDENEDIPGKAVEFFPSFFYE
jgi:hypothetical protein